MVRECRRTTIEVHTQTFYKRIGRDEGLIRNKIPVRQLRVDNV